MARSKTTARNTYKYGGVVLRTRDGEYLYATGSLDWGPRFLSRRDLVGAEVFYCRSDVEYAKTTWGSPLTEVRVEARVTKTIKIIENTREGEAKCKQETSSSST